MKQFGLKTLSILMLSALLAQPSLAVSVIATVSGKPITDTDITARVALINKQGDIYTDNRRKALQNIIDDQIKVDYATNFKAVPADADVEKELKAMNLGDLSTTQRATAKAAISADIAWQTVIARTIVPTIEASAEDIAEEKRDLERDRGLPIEMTIVRLVDIPEFVAAKLTKPKSCDAAVEMAERLGGEPQKFAAAQYELSADIRERVIGLPKLTWSPRQDNSVLLVCSEKKTSEYGKLDEIIKRNTIYKKAMFMADQQLKQLRRKAVVVIHDDKYKM
jgi:hypothetical protein